MKDCKTSKESKKTETFDKKDCLMTGVEPDKGTELNANAVRRMVIRALADQPLSLLTPREKAVLSMRFGVEDGCTHTLEETGMAMNAPTERIRQIEAKAVRELRYYYFDETQKNDPN